MSDREPRVEDLARVAEAVIAGLDANAALAAIRAELGPGGLIYEVVAPADGARWIERRAMMCSRYLRERRLGVLGGPSVRIGVWWGDSLYVLSGAAFFGLEAERRGVALEVLERTLGALDVLS